MSVDVESNVMADLALVGVVASEGNIPTSEDTRHFNILCKHTRASTHLTTTTDSGLRDKKARMSVSSLTPGPHIIS